MKLVLRGVHLDVSRSLRSHVEVKLAAPLERLLSRDSVEMDIWLLDNGVRKGGLDKECRVTLFLPRAPALHLTETTDDIYKSVSLMSDRLDHAAKRYLERHHDHHAREQPPPLA